MNVIRINLSKLLFLLLMLCTMVGHAQWNEAQKILSGDIEANDIFGYSVSLSGDRAIVGAPFEGTAGAAYIFERDGSGNWNEVAKIQASDIEAEDRFGFSVSIDGNHAIAAGANLEGTGRRVAGAAYIFERDGSGNWNEVAKIQASDKQTDDQFGSAVAISGDRVIVGALQESTSAFWAGAAYIFERDGSSNWNEVVKIQASDKEVIDLFGYSVSISGDRAIVGAFLEGTGGSAAGAAYIFERVSSGNWNEVAKIQASDIEAGDGFGVSVSMSGDHAIVGALHEDTGGSDAGSAYIFERDGSGNWKEATKVQASDTEARDNFGYSVSLSGDRAIVGAGFDRAAAGAAYVFERDGSGNWAEVTKIQASDKKTGDTFGRSVSISGDRTIIGAPTESTGGFAAGAAYIFEQGITGIPQIETGKIPEKIFIDNNYPNPFNPTTTIKYGLNTAAWMKITVYNIQGQEIVSLVDEFQQAGYKSVVWNGKNSLGHPVVSGVYIYKMQTGEFVKTHKMLMIK